MKKQLLFGSAFLLSFGAFSQSANRQLFEGAKLVKDKSFENRFIKQHMFSDPQPSAAKKIGPTISPEVRNSSSIDASVSSPILNSTFYRLSGSGNIFGMLISASKPLNYQRILGCVSFIQRKSATYAVSPPADGNLGTIVAYWAKNDASSNSLADWDSTCIWADPTNQGRYPVGGLWNSMPGNLNIDPNKAYVVGMGPVTNGTNWIGDWYASKSLSVTPKNSPGTVAGEEQFIPNTTPWNSTQSPQMKKHDFARYGFNVTDQAVWVAGTIANNINSTASNAQIGTRGAAIIKGTFNSGIMVWSMDSIIPPTELRVADPSKLLQGDPYMKFTPDGTLGYCMFIGVRQGATLSNRGMQPIVYKTTNSGASWNIVNGIDFNVVSPNITRIKNTMRSVGGVSPQIESPWFWREGIDMAIDANGKLHILATQIGHASAHVDSMNYLSTWTIAYAGNEPYYWPHVNTARPLIVDYIGDGSSSWNALIIDSLDTEAPGEESGDGGYNFNPWADPDPTLSVSSDSRMQITSSYDGQFISYSWAESDTNITSNAIKFNEFPNVKVRAYRVCDGSLSPDVFAITGQGSTLGAVKDKAYFHYMSGEMKAGASTMNSATLAIPFTISSNPTTESGQPVNNYFTMAHLGFSFPSAACGSTVTTGVSTVKTEVSESTIFPNPTENNFTVRVGLSNATDISIAVYNAIGQKITETKLNGNVGENNVPMNMLNAPTGVYFVKIKVGKTETTKKLIVE